VRKHNADSQEISVGSKHVDFVSEKLNKSQSPVESMFERCPSESVVSSAQILGRVAASRLSPREGV
jgi:hypothetical protein